MTRQTVKDHKRALNAARRSGAGDGSLLLARESALSLLARSIDFGHGRLAVIRLGIAVDTGADIPPEHWLYCRRVANDCHDRSLQAMFLVAAQKAQAGTPAVEGVH